jgi:mannobiose 2-epimerase
MGGRATPTNAPGAGLWRRLVGRRRHADETRRLAKILYDNLVPFWYPRSLDRERGGYHTHYDAAGRPKPPGARMIVSQCRMLWFFARLARFGHRPAEMLDAADHGVRFLRERMWDARHGGLFWEVDAAGTPTETGKHVCGHAYALYALAEYARASGRADALGFADELFDVLEERAHDRVYGGYVEWFAPDWAPGRLGATPLGDGTARAKLTGTHLHAMEAIAAYCRVSPRPAARERLAELIGIQTSAVVRKDAMACRDRHDRDWTPRPGPDGDRVSYGHDLENVWLVADACEALGAAVYPYVDFFRTCFAYAMRHGWDERHGGFFAAGPPNAAADRRAKVWWVQCEALVAAVWMHRLTGDEQYADVFRRTLAFVERYGIDWIAGEFHREVDETLRGAGDKASVWKVAYHSGRAMMECIALRDST